MDLRALNSSSGSSPFAAQLKAGYANLKFRGFLERDFRDVLVEQSRLRGRIAALVLIGVAVVLTLIEWAVAGAIVVDTAIFIRAVFVVPALAMIVYTTFAPRFRELYPRIAIISVSVLGIAVAFKAQTASLDGDFYMFAGVMLVVVYACLFPGLVFRASASIGALLLGSYFIFGLAMGAPLLPLIYMTAMLLAAVFVCLLASYNLEHVLRTSFLETRLLNELAERDGLTGLYNRRMFDDFIQRIWRQSQREEQPIEIILVDIDHFKIFNDLYGHQAGDDCLKKVAGCIASTAKRPFDFAARYGGEEFVLVLYGPPKEHAKTIPEQIRRDVMDLAIPHDGSTVDN
ncbi:MAG: diguanylate cyclase domain-containing protein, partial [Gammaproteobacteria bacterium]